MNKKILLICLILLTSLMIVGCSEEPIPTTTAAPTTTTTTLYVEHDMSSLQGDILALDEFNGYLYIATSQKLYKIPTNNLTDTSISTPNNIKGINSLDVETLQDPSGNYVDVISGSYPNNPTYNGIIMTESSFATLLDDPTPIAVVSGLTFIGSNSYYLYYNSHFNKVTVGADGVSPNIDVDEANIISIDFKSPYIYACDSTTIYKYNSSFDTPSSLTAISLGLGSTNFIGIGVDDTYMWIIDATAEKLYKIPKSSL